MKTLDPAEAVDDSTGAVYVPIDEDSELHRNGRRPIPSGSATSPLNTFIPRVGSTVSIDSDT
jgi:hypothetical protein